MPEKIKNIETEISGLRFDIGNLTSALREIFNLEGNGQPKEGKDSGGKDMFLYGFLDVKDCLNAVLEG